MRQSNVEPPGSALPKSAADRLAGDRIAALVDAHRLVRVASDRPESISAEIDGLIMLGDRNGWAELSVVARVAAGVAAVATGGSADELLDDARRRAESAADPGSIAVALTFRAALGLRAKDEGRDTASEPEADLAAAVVALERVEEAPLERIVAHHGCALVFSRLELWDAALAQLRAAALIDPVAEQPALAAHRDEVAAAKRLVRLDIITAEVDAACALLVDGDKVGAKRRSELALEQFWATGRPADGPAGDGSLDVMEGQLVLLQAISGQDVSAVVSAMAGRSEISPVRTGLLRAALAVWLSRQASPNASAVVEEAIELLRASEQASPEVLTMVLDLAAQLEAKPAANRLARLQIEKVAARRRRTEASIEALIRAERLRTARDELERQANVDDLTGLANRRGFYRFLNELLAKRQPEVALLVVDIDRFKEVNDHLGHPAGDTALRRLADVLARGIRSKEIAARIGGDEFFLLLEGTGTQMAMERALSIIRAVGSPIEPMGDPGLSVTVGVASGPVAEFDRLLAEADRALYRGKATGGGRCVVADTNV